MYWENVVKECEARLLPIARQSFWGHPASLLLRRTMEREQRLPVMVYHRCPSTHPDNIIRPVFWKASRATSVKDVTAAVFGGHISVSSLAGSC